MNSLICNSVKIFVTYNISPVTSIHTKMRLPMIYNYHVINKISNGSFGVVWKAIHSDSIKEEEVAIKIERRTERKSHLKNELNILKRLKGLPVVPKVIYFGETSNYNYIVMELLGKTIDNYCHSNHVISFSSTIDWSLIRLGISMLHCIRTIHERGIIHRDIKPDNFLFSLDNSKLYIVDFGLSVSYLDVNKCHVPISANDTIVGSVDYISYYIHEGISASRRDDLISMIYVMIYIMNKQLPWQLNEYVSMEERIHKIYEHKYSISPNILCEGTPDILITILVYCYNLNYDDIPDYDYIRFLLETYDR